MSRNFFGVEKGFDVYAENGALKFRILFSDSAPTGTGDQSAAPIGSLLVRTNGELYQKVANAGNSSDYLLNGSSNASVGTWRGESVVAVTNEAQGAGVRDMVANPFTDDNGTALGIGEFVVGKYVITDADGTPLLLEITNVAGNNVTYAAASQALTADDTFVVKHYLPDPDGYENSAIVNFNGSIILKIADLDWNFADGINMAAGYSAQNGSVSSADSVNSAIEKLDGNQQDLITLSGVAQGATDLGSFTGSTIPDNQTTKAALQSLETAQEEIDQNANDLITLSGVAENSTDLGTFTGDIISDNNTVKGALQELETELVDTRGNADDLIALSGVAENSTNLGAWTAPVDLLFSATSTIKALFQRIGDLLMQLRGVEVSGITAATAVDAVPHASVRAIKWIVEVFETASPANRELNEVLVLTNGSAIDESVYGKLKVGSGITGLAISTAINGANLELRVASTPSTTARVRRIEVVKSVL